MFFAYGLRWYLILMAVISVISAVSVLSSHRSTETKAVWVLFILVFFVFGFVVYFMSNDRIMYRRARKRHASIYQRTSRFNKQYEDPQTSEDVVATCRYLNNSGGFAPCTNTAVKYFPSGASTFDDIIESIKRAEKFVFIEFFAVADGILFNRIWNILKEKLKQGVEVKIIYDDIGSRSLSRKTRKKIKDAGGEIRVFNKLMSRFTFALNFRDHRKIVIVDGKVAYTGGCNLADEYINEKRMHGYWKDCGLRMEGEAVDQLTLFFLRQWEYIVKKAFDYAPYLNHFTPTQDTSTVVPYIGGPEFEHSICKSVYENVISSAKKKLYIMTPYFVPDDSIRQCIINSALAGVDVRIILPSVPDKMYVYVISKDNAENLIKYGVKVYYAKDMFLHSKVVLTEQCAVVGSVNFDMRSFFQQFENAVLTDDVGVMNDIDKDFAQTFENSKLMSKKQKNGIVKTMIIGALRIVSPLM
jgi:cardiolipin synthase